MAEDITDVYIATEAGDAGWQSLSALAAEQVEAELPIEDAGKTVKIWSAASNFINFDTAGTSDFKMDPSSNFTANGKFISKATGTTEVSFSSTNGQDGFAIVSAGYPGIVSGNQQIQNWNYTADVDSYKRYQATVKARGGDDSYSELMFLSDASSNQGMRFLACGKDVTGVRGWPLGLEGIGTATPDSGGASALIHVGYAIEGTAPTEYTPLVVGTSTRSDFILMAYGTKALTLDPMKNDAVFVYSVRSDSLQGTTDSDAKITLGDQATISKGIGGTYEPTNENSLVNKKYCDDKIWVGTTAQYDAIADKNPKTLYCITD